MNREALATAPVLTAHDRVEPKMAESETPEPETAEPETAEPETAEPETPEPARSPARHLIAPAAGLAIGVLTLGGQMLPRIVGDDRLMWAVGEFAAQHVSNSGAAWSLFAFLTVAALGVTGWRAALAGTLTLLGATAGYYAATTVFLHDDISGAALRGPLVWGIVALVAGPLFGLAGAIWSRGDSRRRPWALAAMSSAFLAEALYYAVVLGYRGDAVLSAAEGIMLAVMLSRSPEERRACLIRLVPGVLVMALAFAGAVLVTSIGFTI